MKIFQAPRMAPFSLAILFIAWGADTASARCKRKDLKGFVDKYFAALEAHNPSGLPLASTVKYTENGKEVAVGKGFWETAGKALLKRSLIDTEKCGTHSQAVMEENGRPILFGVRLKIDKKKVTEIESVIAREKEFAFNAKGVLDTKDQDWETILPKKERTPRAVMVAAANNYFDMFAKEPTVSVPFAKPCDRWENGTQTTVKSPAFPAPADMVEHDCSPKGLVITNHGPRRIWVDTEAGIAVAYVLFAGGLPDFHMLKMRNGKVYWIQAVVGAGSKTMGWPDEPAGK